MRSGATFAALEREEAHRDIQRDTARNARARDARTPAGLGADDACGRVLAVRGSVVDIRFAPGRAARNQRSGPGRFRRHVAGGEISEISEVDVIFARARQGNVSTPERRVLLPLDLEALAMRQPPRQRPLYNLDPVVLHEKLMAEYVFALLTEAAAKALGARGY